MTENGYMPPWPPDTNYSRFSHERTLSANEISMIQSWVAAGAPQGILHQLHHIQLTLQLGPPLEHQT